ncbi:ubiquinol-cytochrome c reductase iron-sulfur subunit [Spirosoma soli]|uniref:Ubiquinol-cytochrome c reductase iron-sulfur subunit n=1 Tax=Spirosoma soli TaxID=1770529 RepID=A0ABW5M4G0_9BACT
METIFPTADQPTMPRHEFFRLVGTTIGAIMLTRCMAGCAGQANGDPQPDANQKIDFTLRLDEQANANLKVKGGYVIVNEIIVAQTKDGDFVAVSANCTHQGTKLVFKPNDDQFYCPLHLSRFDIGGKVINGPASLPLTKYLAVSNPATGTVRVYN